MERARMLQVAGVVVAVAAVVGVLVVALGGGVVPQVEPTPLPTEDVGGGPGDGGPGDEGGGLPGEGDDDTGDPEAAPSVPPVEVDWTMAPRYGLDTDGDGFTDHACDEGDADFVSHDGACYEASPATFTVTLDACATADTAAATFRWQVAGEAVAGAGCEVTLELGEGSHEVVVAAAVDGTDVAGPTTTTVEVDDILVIAVGDSWTVGLGAPDIPGNGSAYDAWVAALVDLRAAQERADRAAAELDAARRSLDAALDDLRAVRSAADDAFDECLTTRFGVTVVRVTGLGDCLDALGDLGLSLVDSVRGLTNRIDGAVEDAQDLVDRARSAVDDAAGAAADAAEALAAARDALRAAEDVAPGAYLHEGCNRSANAGPAQAARRIEEADPRTSVTLLHLSCSGADVSGLIGGSDQIGAAAAASGDREVDLLLLGVGGNDMRLNTILGRLCPRQLACHLSEVPVESDAAIRAWCTTPAVLGGAVPDIVGDVFERAGGEIADACTELYEGALADANGTEDVPPDTSARAWFDQLLRGSLPRDSCASTSDPADLGDAGLALRYDCVARELADRFGERLAASDVVVWEYIDVVHNDAGDICAPGVPEGTSEESLRGLPGYTTAELRWADEVFTTINGEIEAAADRHGWTFLATNAGSRQHGMCSRANWIARPDQSILKDPTGSAIAHPNLAGMDYLGRAIADGVSPLLP